MGIFRFGKNPADETPAPAAPVAAAPAIAAGGRGAFAPIEDILRLTVESGASDLHLTVGTAPVLRINGKLVRLDTRALFPEDTDNIATELANGDQIHKLRTEGSVDFAMTSAGRNRFRISLYRQKRTTAIALRMLPRQMLSSKEIGLPRITDELIRLPRGLVLVTGPTGSGKTTSLAAMLNDINLHLGHHIVTIEDPIEYLHEHQEGMVNQREVGTDVGSFAEGLRRALRQDPDVILVGEMRDLETMETAIRAAETGHLVFSTLHTTGASDRGFISRGAAGADPRAALDESQGGDLAAPHPADRSAGTHRGLRGDGEHAVRRRAHPRQQDVPPCDGNSDRREIRHEHDRAVARGPLPRGRDRA